MFRTEAQRYKVCGILLQQMVRGSADLWTEHGPTELAWEMVENDASPLSSGERVLLLAAFAIWNGDRRLGLAEIFDLDQSKQLALGSLIVAIAQGGSAIDEWMMIWDATTPGRFDG